MTYTFNKAKVETAKKDVKGDKTPFVNDEGSWTGKVISGGLFQVKNPRSKIQNHWCAAVEFEVQEVHSGALVPGDKRKTFYTLGIPGYETKRNEIALQDCMKHLAAIFQDDVTSIDAEALDTAFKDDGAVMVGATVKVDVTKNAKGFPVIAMRGLELPGALQG